MKLVLGIKIGMEKYSDEQLWEISNNIFWVLINT